MGYNSSTFSKDYSDAKASRSTPTPKDIVVDIDYSFPTQPAEIKTGGWLDEMKKGGQHGWAQLRAQSLPKSNKNVQSSINKLMLRNETLFGPPGHRLYTPNMKTGGWLDNIK